MADPTSLDYNIMASGNQEEFDLAIRTAKNNYTDPLNIPQSPIQQKDMSLNLEGFGTGDTMTGQPKTVLDSYRNKLISEGFGIGGGSQYGLDRAINNTLPTKPIRH